MTAKLVSYTKMIDSDLSLTKQVAYVARVSNPSSQINNIDSCEKLVRYLITHKHWSPFEMVSLTLEIVTSRDIARQMLRHRSFTFQEFSQRYADPTLELGLIAREARMQDTKNRQNSLPATDEDLKQTWTKMQEDVIAGSIRAYQWAVRKGVAKEVARAVLPEGMVQSRIYMSGTLRSWVHYVQLRSGNGTQLEHRIVARECAEAIAPVFPEIVDFIEKE